MGTTENDLMNGFSDVNGTTMGSKRNSEDVLKSSLPRKRTVPASQKQLLQQARFALIINFLSPLRLLLNLTFRKSAAKYMSGYNKAFSVNTDCVTGDYPDLVIDYAKVLLSKGSLGASVNIQARSAKTGKLVFTWADNSYGIRNLISDTVFVAAYSEQQKRWVQNHNITTRAAGTCILDVLIFSGKPVQTYLGFISADRKKVSMSVFTGVVNIL